MWRKLVRFWWVWPLCGVVLWVSMLGNRVTNAEAAAWTRANGMPRTAAMLGEAPEGFAGPLTFMMISAVGGVIVGLGTLHRVIGAGRAPRS